MISRRSTFFHFFLLIRVTPSIHRRLACDDFPRIFFFFFPRANFNCLVVQGPTLSFRLPQLSDFDFERISVLFIVPCFSLCFFACIFHHGPLNLIRLLAFFSLFLLLILHLFLLLVFSHPEHISF